MILADALADRPPPSVWDGEALISALSAATALLVANQEHVNALNVFPVPDGDTGTNMALTMRAALEEADKLDGTARSRAGEVARRIEFGALMGARGNSGVILSQIFRGFAKAIAARDEIDGRDLALALDGAREMAYKAVMEPVEGTMLTVIRIAAEHATAASRRTPSIQTVLSHALAGATEALARTPEMLDRLREAGVVDAGGQGVVHILDGLDRFARGEPVAAGAVESTATLGRQMAFLDQVAELHGEDAFGYCTNFMVFGSGIDFDRARMEIAAMGKSAVIVGDERVLKVHIHIENPGRLLDFALGLGELGQIKIDNMNAQVQTLTDQRSAPAGGPLPAQTESVSTIAVLAVAAGAGLAAALRSMGATGIVPGGQTMNPSIEELLQAVEAAPAADVILLPNNPNILLAANQVPGLSRKRVRVVPARSIPQGLSALAAFNAGVDLNVNATAMGKAVGAVRTVEVTNADKDASVNGLLVAKGQLIGLLDDRLVASGDDETTVTCAALNRADAENAELITIFTGDGQTPEAAAPLKQAIATRFPAAEIEVVDGGQPHYRLVIAVE